MMDYGGVDKRKSKKDLKRKRLNRVYKRGGQFRSHNVEETKTEEETNNTNKKGKKQNKKKNKKGKKKY
jgi:hypothetical protein